MTECEKELLAQIYLHILHLEDWKPHPNSIQKHLVEAKRKLERLIYDNDTEADESVKESCEKAVKVAEEAARSARISAIYWTDDAMSALKTCEDVKEWMQTNAKGMSILSERHPDLWKKVISAKDKRKEELEVGK